MRGRKPNPLKIHPGQRAADQPPAKAPTCPKILQGEARREWRRITRLLLDRGTIAELDRTALAVYCTAWQEWQHAQAEITKTGHVVKSPSGYPILSPWRSVAKSAADEMHRKLAEFGLSPAARARGLAPKPKQIEHKNPWDGLLAHAN